MIFLFMLFAQASLPPQFSECLRENSSSAFSAAAIAEMAKTSQVTYCKTQTDIITTLDLANIIKNPNVNAGISVVNTIYSVQELTSLARAGKYMLYVDGTRISVLDLVNLSREGVQLAVISGSAGLTRPDLLRLAQERPFILNVNSNLLKSDLQDYAKAGVQLVIRSSQSGLSSQDITDIVKASADRVTIMP